MLEVVLLKLILLELFWDARGLENSLVWERLCCGTDDYDGLIFQFWRDLNVFQQELLVVVRLNPDRLLRRLAKLKLMLDRGEV